MESNKLDPSTLCRTCMCEGTNMKSLFHKEKDKKTVTDLLEFITNISINSDDSLPKQVCNECETFLHKADHFKRRCLNVELKLKELFSDKTPSTISTIKHEDNEQETTIDTAEPYQCSICSSRYAEITLLENHVFDFHKLKKIPLFTDLNLFSNAKAEVITLETIPEKEEKVIKIVKEEFIDEFDNEIQFDSGPEQIEFESNEDKNILNQPQTIVAIDRKPIDDLNKKHKCEKCNQDFKSAVSLNIHKRKHKEKKSNERKYQCSTCSRKFLSKSGLTNHLRCHEKKEDVKYTCGRCKREFKHKAHLDNHMVTLHANEKGFSCDFCSKNFATEESLEIHKDLHKIDKKHTCRYCEKSFYMLSTLTDHIRTHTGEKPYLCSTCGRGFSQKTNLAQHMRRHLGLKPFACDRCDHRFVSKGELVAHTRKHSGAHPFICDECGNGFTTSSSLVKHRRTHSGERPYACDLCHMSSLEGSVSIELALQLVAHTRKHSGAHPFICNECGNGFTTSSSLVKHRRTHSGERPYACDLCHMRFAASGTLKNHRRTHTGEKPYQCSHCEKAFVQKNDLVSHVRWHTGERPYTCAVCGSSFHKPSALRSHAKMHTRDNKEQQLIPY